MKTKTLSTLPTPKQQEVFMGTWVDFKAVKSGASMLAVLQRYGVRLKASGKNELRGPCPIHGGRNPIASTPTPRKIISTASRRSAGHTAT
jgi:hypothetical protein